MIQSVLMTAACWMRISISCRRISCESTDFHGVFATDFAVPISWFPHGFFDVPAVEFPSKPWARDRVAGASPFVRPVGMQARPQSHGFLGMTWRGPGADGEMDRCVMDGTGERSGEIHQQSINIWKWMDFYYKAVDFPEISI